MHTMYSIKAFYLKDSPLKKDTRDMMCMKFRSFIAKQSQNIPETQRYRYDREPGLQWQLLLV